jgi:hypothetical protein
LPANRRASRQVDLVYLYILLLDNGQQGIDHDLEINEQ